MFFKNFNCPKCGRESFFADMDATIDSYIKNELNTGSLLESLIDISEVRPGYIIFTCSVSDCSYSEKILEKDILKKLLDDWTEMAKVMIQKSLTNTYEFEQYKTRYIYDERFKKFMTDLDYKYYNISDMNKDYLEFLKNEKKKRSKIS